MNPDHGLTAETLRLMQGVFGGFPALQTVILFGSRATGTFSSASDIDLALVGGVSVLETAQLADQLNDLPLPYRFDVQSLSHIQNPALLEQIHQTGILLWSREAST